MYLTSTPTFIRSLTRKNLTWEMAGRSDEIFLTFDDGPIPVITPQVLNILDSFQAKATFFCVGDNVRKYPEIYQQIIDRGHATGNHTFHHLDGWKTDPETYLDNIARCSEVVNSKLFRPPYGKLRPSLIGRIKKDYTIIMWSVLTGDFDKEARPEKILENSIQHTSGGSIVVFHDSLKAADRMLYALPRFIEYFSLKGYTFSSLSN